MKPWFEKELAEADILKFPKPKAKVIRMPNVQSYPDFLTGVSDLQAKQKDSTISQETYNKLYADLIHRFMKKESFDTPWYLREATKKDRGLNRGDAMEFLLAVAIYHRMLQVNYINENSLLNFIITELPHTNPVRKTKQEGYDIFKLDVGVKEDTFKYLFNKNIYTTHWKGLIPNAVKFANEQLQEQIQYIHDNNRKDAVEINSFGLAGNKIDVEAWVKYRDPNNQLQREPLKDLTMSLKVDSGKFGQSSGFNTDEDASFKKLFGALGFKDEIDQVLTKHNIEEFTKTGGKWDKMASMASTNSNLRKGGENSKGYKEAEKWGEKANALALPRVKAIYSDMATIIHKRFTSEQTDERAEYKLLGNLISSEISGGTDISMIQFSKTGYSMLSSTDVKKLKRFVRNKIELDVVITQKKVNPVIQFIDKKSELLFCHIRSTFNHYGYLRNFIEQGPGMDVFKSWPTSS